MLNWIKGILSGLGVVGVFLFLGFLFCINGIALHYGISFLASYVKHVPVHPSWILCILLGLITGPLPVTVAVVTWAVSFFI